MNVSIIIPTRNEKPEMLANTVKCFLNSGANEIIVLDDASDTPVVLENVICKRHRTPKGPAFCRNEGASMASGDVLIWADAHVHFHDSLDAFASLSLKRRAVICTATRSMKRPQKWTAYGSLLYNDKDYPGFCLNGNLKKPKNKIAPVPALYGSVYAMSRDTWEYIRGLPRTVYWGYNEQALSMACHLLGVEVLVDCNTVIDHNFRKQFPYEVCGWDPLANRIIVHRMLFSDMLWRAEWEPRFKKLAVAWQRAMQHRVRIEHWRSFYQSRRVISDRKMLEKLGMGVKSSFDLYDW